ncbi:hypothetical protein F4813DRAFT_365912 [Daldinia decipiens]|uniref:uncharacterized protein n=1 Tax=Daldinia decipiens TaxID=326647 RepID=UPI0020C31F48|nr:uncharacterized protein F4813DRAFT_365912 [Daldinia decipiens]KAI1655958.1 hypothetical protein F4813DRAFT_365912 [Daldinia decipiens]
MEIYLARISQHDDGTFYVERKQAPIDAEHYVAISHAWGHPETIEEVHIKGVGLLSSAQANHIFYLFYTGPTCAVPGDSGWISFVLTRATDRLSTFQINLWLSRPFIDIASSSSYLSSRSYVANGLVMLLTPHTNTLTMPLSSMRRRRITQRSVLISC